MTDREQILTDALEGCIEAMKYAIDHNGDIWNADKVWSLLSEAISDARTALVEDECGDECRL